MLAAGESSPLDAVLHREALLALKRREVIALIQEADLTELKPAAARMVMCRERIVLSVASGPTQIVRIVGGFRCKVPFCPQCIATDQRRYAARYRAKLLAAGAKYPGTRWVSLTLTRPAVPAGEFRVAHKEVTNAFDRMTRRQSWPAQGGIRIVEPRFARSHPDEPLMATPHIHAALMLRPGVGSIGMKELRARLAHLWAGALGLDTLPFTKVLTLSAAKHGSVADTIVRRVVAYGLKGPFSQGEAKDDPTDENSGSWSLPLSDPEVFHAYATLTTGLHRIRPFGNFLGSKPAQTRAGHSPPGQLLAYVWRPEEQAFVVARASNSNLPVALCA